MPDRLPIDKTYKLFIGGKFPRSESGRTTPISGRSDQPTIHVSRASRKDLRDAVEAARDALPKWSGEAPGGATAMLRSQILYRVAEMLEGKREELTASIALATAPTRPNTPHAHAQRQVAASIDRLVHYAGWCDKYQQVLGCNNAVAGPFYNFTTPEATGVVAVVCPDEAPLLALISLLAPVLAAGNTAVVLASDTNPIPACILAEACVTGDVPPGVINILTGQRAELLPHVSTHREIAAIHAAGVSPDHARLLRQGSAENLKRVTIRGLDHPIDWFDPATCESAWWIEPFVEMKTVWHPSGA